MDMKRKLISTALLLGLVPAGAMADSLSPSAFSATLAVGGSTTIHKTVTIDQSPSAKVDVFFLADTTGSMGGRSGASSRVPRQSCRRPRVSVMSPSASANTRTRAMPTATA